MEILVVEDHPMMVNAIRLSIEAMRLRATVVVAGSLGELKERLARRPPPAMVVTDLNLPDTEGLETLRAVRQLLPTTPLMVFSALGNPALERQVMTSGADGFVSKSDTTASFADELRKMLQAFAPGLAASSARSEASDSDRNHPMRRLTQRQRAVLVELCQGHANKEIAHRLGIAEETVRSHVGDIYNLLDVRNRTQASALYLRWIHEHGEKY